MPVAAAFHAAVVSLPAANRLSCFCPTETMKLTTGEADDQGSRDLQNERAGCFWHLNPLVGIGKTRYYDILPLTLPTHLDSERFSQLGVSGGTRPEIECYGIARDGFHMFPGQGGCGGVEGSSYSTLGGSPHSLTFI